MTDALRKEIGRKSSCNVATRTCVLLRVRPERYLLVSSVGANSGVTTDLIDLQRPVTNGMIPPVLVVDLATAKIEMREVKRRQLTVDGKPVGEPFE